jgi:light-harvesting complex I chlorophyll a/b binding protein 3
MLGAAGCLAPEALGKMGLIPEATNVVWFKSGVIPPLGTPEGLYAVDPWALFWIEVVLMQFAELRRWQDYKNPGSMGKQYFLGLENFLKGSGEPAYPGAPLAACIGR